MKKVILVALFALSARGVEWNIQSGAWNPQTCSYSRQICFGGYQVQTGTHTQAVTYAADVESGGYWTQVKSGTQKQWNPNTCRYEYKDTYSQQWNPTYKTQYYTVNEQVATTGSVAPHCAAIVQVDKCYTYAFQGKLVPCRSSAGYPYFKADGAYWGAEGLYAHGTDYNEANALPYGDEVTRTIGSGHKKRHR